MVNMNDLRNTSPFEGTDSEYRTIDSVLRSPIKIMDFKFFDNDKGEGVFILCENDDDEIFHLCTHSVSLVGSLKNPKVREALDAGDVVTTMIVKRKSSKSDRMVYSFA